MFFKENFDIKEIKRNIEWESCLFKNGMVIHNDIDGLVSGAYFAHKTKLPLNGIFKVNSQSNMDSEMYLTDTDVENKVFIDCSMVSKNVFTIDHHSILPSLYSKNSFNCNKYTESSDILKSSNFYRKNPTGCICWLLYIFGEDITNYTNDQLDLVLLCDSLYSNYIRYEDNCKSWLKAFGQDRLIDYMEETKDTIYQRMSALNSHLGLYKQGYQIFDTTTHTFKSNVTEEDTQVILDKICNIMGWNKLKVPQVNYIVQFQNHNVNLENTNKFIEEQKENIVTNAVRNLRNSIYFCTYKDTIQI